MGITPDLGGGSKSLPTAPFILIENYFHICVIKGSQLGAFCP